MDWQKSLQNAYAEARKSTNPSTQNGAVLVSDTGEILVSASNDFPDGISESPERLIRDLRLKYSVHAERNVLYRAAKNGVKTEGLTMVCCWAACMDCAQAIIQTGLKRLVTHKQFLDRSGRWLEEIEMAFAMLREAGVEVVAYDAKIGGGPVLRDQVNWEP